MELDPNETVPEDYGDSERPQRRRHDA